MKSKPIEQLTKEELTKEHNTLKGAVIGLGIVMVLAYGTLIVLAIRSKTYALISIVPTGFLCLLPVSIRLRKIKAELKNRQQ